MLYEIPHIRQENRHLTKRWFTSYEMDLFAWFQESAPVRIQLCIDKLNTEKLNSEQAVDGDQHHSFRFYTVDDGESMCDESLAYKCKSRFKQSPLLNQTRHPAAHDIECEPSSLAQIARDFLAASERIDAGIFDFIFARLMERPQLQVKPRQANPRRLKAMNDAMRAGHCPGKHPAAT